MKHRRGLGHETKTDGIEIDGLVEQDVTCSGRVVTKVTRNVRLVYGFDVFVVV